MTSFFSGLTCSDIAFERMLLCCERQSRVWVAMLFLAKVLLLRKEILVDFLHPNVSRIDVGGAHLLMEIICHLLH